jgi:hydrogenase maturation protein HypF
VVTVRESARLPAQGSTTFEIHHSDTDSAKSVNVLPDLATCDDCRAELVDSTNRRFQYPFTNCTNCGPRYTIVVDIPYDRPNTTMREFVLCPACREEYENPTNRRFHAQPNACPVCGPKLDGTIADVAVALHRGEIVALKGIGGFQLLVDARQAAAVARLRQRKHREEKPFALMMPSLEMAREYCEITSAEQELLESQAAPIVLLHPKSGSDIAWNVAHCSPYLGVMLPYSPLHHLLMRECPFPLIATSGNRSDEPIAIANEEAATRLKDIADHFLMHNRPIVRACDDSVVRLTRGHAGRPCCSHALCQGLMSRTPQPSKSPVSRVATIAP